MCDTPLCSKVVSYLTDGMQSPVEKEMAAAYVTTIPCERYTAHKVQGKPYFCNVCPCATLFAKGCPAAKLLSYIVVVDSFACLNEPESYASRTLSSSRATQAGHVVKKRSQTKRVICLTRLEAGRWVNHPDR